MVCRKGCRSLSADDMSFWGNLSRCNNGGGGRNFSKVKRLVAKVGRNTETVILQFFLRQWCDESCSLQMSFVTVTVISD